MKVPRLKSFLPKGLYGRAALILLLPVIVIQLVVSVVFIQRHFEGVTRLMVTNVVFEIDFLLDRINQSADIQAANADIRRISEPLGFRVSLTPFPDQPTPDLKRWSDLTGSNVIKTFHDSLQATRSVDLATIDRFVDLRLTSNKGEVSVVFGRYRVSASNPHQLLVLMIATSILMTVISIVFLRNQVRPIRRLARAAEAFGKGRIVDYHVSGATEVRSAGRAFLEMRARIERQIEQRTLMLSGVSHDMRTPLTRLKLGLNLIDDDPEIRDMINDVDDMEAMLEEFLAFARGDSGEELSLCNPVELAQKLVQDAERGNSAISLNISKDAESCAPVPMRPMAMARAIENLISNAGRYSTVSRLKLTLTPGKICYTVEDNGPGIPEDKREIATRPFTRLDQARNQDHGSGVGLGLSIAMDIASSHGGYLTLTESSDLGGLKATLCIPR